MGLIFKGFASNDVQQELRIGSETDSGIAWNSYDLFGLNSNPILSPGMILVLYLYDNYEKFNTRFTYESNLVTILFCIFFKYS